MSDGFVQIPIDSNGKLIDTSELNVNGRSVERQRINLADLTDPLAIAAVKNTSPLSTDYGVVVRPAPLNATSGYNVVSASTDNAAIVKNSPGAVYGYEIYNNANYPVFVKLYNKATLPNPAADASLLKRTIGLQAGTRASYYNENGMGGFSSGIGIAIVKLIAPSDDTPVLANDCSVDLDYL